MESFQPPAEDPAQDDATRKLLDSIGNGDDSAYAQLFGRFSIQLGVFVARRMGAELRSRMQLEDVLQDVFVRVVEKIRNFEHRGTGSFYGWLCGVARNIVREHLRKPELPTLSFEDALKLKCSGETPISLELPASGPTPSRVAIGMERLAKADEFFRALPEKEREIVWDRVIEGLPVKDVAAKHGISPGQVTKIVAKALRRSGRGLDSDEFPMG